MGYRIGRVLGSAHGWHCIPVNILGLYLKPAVLSHLLYQCSKVIPRKISVSISHTIPTAKYPGSTNTTQLSFNNTIYSLIYELEDTDNVTNDDVFKSKADFLNFTGTFDGGKATDGTQNTLPQPDIFFKFPWRNSVLIEQTTTCLVGGSKQVTAGDEKTILNAYQVAEQFCPEFYTDSENMYVLYPGENQYNYTYDVSESDGVVIDFDNHPYNLPEDMQDLRGRKYLNSEAHFNTDNLAYNEVVPRIHYNAFDIRNTTNVKKSNDVYTNQSPDGFNAKGPNVLWIKGNPILSDTNDLITHTFQGMITYAIELDVVPREMIIPRPLQWGWCVENMVQYQDTAGKKQVQTTYTTPYPRILNYPFFQNNRGMRNVYCGSNIRNLTSTDTANYKFEHSPEEFRSATAQTSAIRPCNQFTKVTMPPNKPPSNLKTNIQMDFEDNNKDISEYFGILFFLF